MSPIARNFLAPVVGVTVGSVVNIFLVNIGPAIIPLPEGADVSTMESLQDSMLLFTPAHFLFPFLGHALGTLTGAFVAAKVAFSHSMKFAIAIGVFFLIGGLAAIMMLGGPLWFNITDLLCAYIPMGLLGGILASSRRTQGSL